MDPETPYRDLVAGTDPLTILAATPARVQELVHGWDDRRWALSYAPGKWNAAQLVLHLTHDEIGWCNRVRLALSVEGYVVQPYDGAVWVDVETSAPPDVALAAFAALRRLNVRLYERLSADQRRRFFKHPELGDISIQWIIEVLAGHDLHHLQHLRAIAAA